MAEVLALKDRDILHSEQISMGALAETLSTAGATVPTGTGDIVVTVPTGSTNDMHYLSSETPTSSLGNILTYGHPARIPHHLQKRVKFVADDAADVSCGLVYYRGSAPQNLAASLSDPT